MCQICQKVRTMPLQEALKVVAQAVQQRGAPACLDKLIGELVGEPEPKVDRAADGAWERGRGKGR